MQAIPCKLRVNSSLAWRVLWVVVLVALCHLGNWWWLRTATTDALMRASLALGIPMHRVASDLIEVAGIQARIVVSCTLIDAFLGAVPLLYRTSLSLLSNLCRMTLLFVALFSFNIFRLTIGFAALTRGLPWWLSHECISGITYFFLFLFIVHQHAWRAAPSPERLLGRTS